MAIAYLHNTEDAKDAVQEAALSAYQSFVRLKNIAYLKTILDNFGEGENASEASDENAFAAQADAAVEIQSAD